MRSGFMLRGGRWGGGTQGSVGGQKGGGLEIPAVLISCLHSAVDRVHIC